MAKEQPVVEDRQAMNFFLRKDLVKDLKIMAIESDFKGAKYLIEDILENYVAEHKK